MNNEFLTKAFVKRINGLKGYEDYPVKNIPSFFTLDYTENLKQQKMKYKTIQERIICYKQYEKGNNDICECHITELKHNTLISLPSSLIFKDLPEKIEYEITSENMPDKVTGVISIEK